MQEVLNYFLYFVIAIYVLDFVYQGYLQVQDEEGVEVEQSAKDEKSVELPVLSTTKKNRYRVVNPAQAEYSKVTVKQMREYIDNQQLKPQLEQIMQIKLYKARKQDLYNALRAISITPTCPSGRGRGVWDSAHHNR